MFRLAHISDIHLGPLPKIKRRELFSKRITGYVNFRRNRSSALHPEITENLVAYLKTLDPDHTAITGDLINLGLPAEIETAKKWLELLGEPRDHTVVLGNHDAYVRGARDRAMSAWQNWIIGDDSKLVSSEKDYPVLRRRGDISIIACNSARASAPFLATGYFKSKQAKKLLELLNEERRAGQCCVVLIHHPPQKNATHRHKRLLGSKRFRVVIAQAGADLILHGHTHLATTAFIEGPDKKVPVICVPAAFQWPGHHKPPAGINLFEINRKNDNWRITLERHGLSEQSPTQFQLLESTVF
jgi:3',5'-cyclic AMP phosphodiesterase CpdA